MTMQDELLQTHNPQNLITNSVQEEDEKEENYRLSFAEMVNNIRPGPITSWADEHFEFFTSQTTRDRPVSSNKRNDDVVLFGKIIKDELEQQLMNEYEKRDYFATLRSQSSRKPDHDVINYRPRISSSTRYSYTGRGDQRVSLSSLTSMSAKSRRRMFMFGPVKLKPEMELSVIRQRQARRSKVEKTVVVSGGAGSSLMIAKRSTSNYLMSVLTRSFGCIC